MHKMANAGFWSVCLSAVECVPDSMDVKNNEGKTFVDIYGAASLKCSCAKILRLCGGASKELKGVYKTLCEKYPEAKDPYAVAVDKSMVEHKKEESEKPLLSNIEFWFED